MATRNGQSSPIGDLKPAYISFDGGYTATIVLGANKVDYRKLYAATEFIQIELPTATCRPRMTESGFTITVEMGARSIEGFNEASRRKLTELVQPRFSAQVTAIARVSRDELGHHTGTIVTMTLQDTGGNGIAPISVEQVFAVNGVLRARVERKGQAIQFSLVPPDDVEQVSAAVAEALSLHLKNPVEIHDPKPENALLPQFDYQPSDEVTAA